LTVLLINDYVSLLMENLDLPPIPDNPYARFADLVDEITKHTPISRRGLQTTSVLFEDADIPPELVRGAEVQHADIAILTKTYYMHEEHGESTPEYDIEFLGFIDDAMLSIRYKLEDGELTTEQKFTLDDNANRRARNQNKSVKELLEEDSQRNDMTLNYDDDPERFDAVVEILELLKANKVFL